MISNLEVLFQESAEKLKDLEYEVDLLEKHERMLDQQKLVSIKLFLYVNQINSIITVKNIY